MLCWRISDISRVISFSPGRWTGECEGEKLEDYDTARDMLVMLSLEDGSVYPRLPCIH